ncbi:MAG: ABC transporter permease, partial [Acidobacteriota bacterium]
MRELLRRLRFLFRRRQFERELDEEMRHHLALKAEQQGGAPFGNLMLLKEDSRAAWTWTLREQFAQDVRYGIRAMAANKIFTAMAVLSLALGIGANTAIYSFMDAVLLRALPVPHPEELVVVNWRAKDFPPLVHHLNGEQRKENEGGISCPNIPFPAYEALRDQHDAFSSLFAFQAAGRLNIVVHGSAELASGSWVTGNFFSGLGVSPAAGRLLDPEDDRAGAPPVVVISYAWWQRRFAGDPHATGQSILINNMPFMVAGISRPEFFGVSSGGTPDIYLPMRARPLLAPDPQAEVKSGFFDRNFYWLEVMGRLRPGVSLPQAQSQLAGRFRQFVTATASGPKEQAILPVLSLENGASGLDSLRRQYSEPLYMLMTMVGLILAIACANIANMLLARSEARRREMAVRLSLGAGRARLIRQLLTESLLLALAGGFLGIGVAAAGIRFLTWLLSNGYENFTLRATLDWRALSFTLLLAVFSGVLFGLAPALRATRVDITPALKETRAGTRPRRQFWGVSPGRALVASQIAVSLLLVVAAGLFVRTLATLNAVELGFNRENILLATLIPTQAGYKGAALTRLYADLQSRFRALPGVRNVSLSELVLVSGSSHRDNVVIPGRARPDRREPDTSVARIGPDFFTTMQIPVLLGRGIDEGDQEGAPAAAVVNELFAQTFFPGESPLGRHFGLGGGKQMTDLQIVGVVKNARYQSLKREIPPVIYTSYAQPLNGYRIDQMFFEL